MIKSFLTIDELTEILDELEIEYEVEWENSEENEDPFIKCVMSDEPFNIVPLGQGPFYEEFLLRTVLLPDLDPSEMCNQFNRTYNYCSAFPATTHGDSTNEEDEQTIVAVERAVMLCGGVTRNHIISTLQMWETILINAASFFNGISDVDDETSE